MRGRTGLVILLVCVFLVGSAAGVGGLLWYQSRDVAERTGAQARLSAEPSNGPVEPQAPKAGGISEAQACALAKSTMARYLIAPAGEGADIEQRLGACSGFESVTEKGTARISVFVVVVAKKTKRSRGFTQTNRMIVKLRRTDQGWKADGEPDLGTGTVDDIKGAVGTGF